METYSIKQALQKLDTILKKEGLSQHVDARTIQKWIIEDDLRSGEVIPSILYGLYFPEPPTVQAFNELFAAVQAVHNLSPLMSLDGETPMQKKAGLPKEHQGHMRVAVTELGSMDWYSLYGDIQKLMMEQQFFEARELFDEMFSHMLERSAVHPEVYRFYGNLALMHLACGNPDVGEAMLNIALELNPQYDFALNIRKDLNDGKYDDMIQAGMTAAIAKRREEDYDLYDIRENWSTEKITAELSYMGIDIHKEKFCKNIAEYNYLGEYIQDHWDPLFTGKGLDEDFLWMAADVLYERWCQDSTAFLYDEYEQAIFDLEDLVFTEKRIVRTTLPDVLSVLEKYEKASESFWQGYYKRRNIPQKMWFADAVDFLSKCMTGNCAQRIADIASQFSKKHPGTFFDVIALLWKIINKESHEKLFSQLEKRYGKQSIFFLCIADVYDEIGERKTARNYFDRYEALADKEYKKQQKQEKKDAPRFHKAMKKMMEEFLQKQPAWKYYEWLKQWNINFETEELTTTPHNNIYATIGAESGVIHKEKIGRNDPCPCGSGKKYKKCCLN